MTKEEIELLKENVRKKSSNKIGLLIVIDILIVIGYYISKQFIDNSFMLTTILITLLVINLLVSIYFAAKSSIEIKMIEKELENNK